MSKRAEGCTVAMGATEVSGPTPVQAPYLAGKLAKQLLDGLNALPPNPTVRFRFVVRPLITFSFELAARLVARLAQMNACVEVCLNCSKPRIELFAAHDVGASICARTAERDPHELTARLGVEPTSVHRAGDRPSPRSKRVFTAGFWQYELRGASPLELNGLVRDLHARMPPSVASLWGEDEVCIHLAVQGENMSGGFELDAHTVVALAALNAPVSFFFGATGP